ncbi:MAG: pilus assembly protein [Methylobacteriaceae bacterium]|nr:pilus assembly protein [Methylobacteriaceae bacterium]
MFRPIRFDTFSPAARARAAGRRLADNERGNVGMLFALSLLPLIGVVGAAVDYSRGSSASVQLKGATDSAALAAAQKIGAAYSRADREAAALAAINSNIAGSTLIQTFNLRVRDTNANGVPGVEVQADALVETSFMKVFGQSRMTVSARAESIAGVGNNVEIALVLDTTGSMVNDMPALRQSARSFVETVFSVSNNANVKMSVVPYVAAVNIGPNINPAMLDTNVNSAFHGQNHNWRDFGYLAGCNPDPNAPPGNGGGGWTPPPDPGSPGGQDRTGALTPEVFDPVAKARRFAAELFGVKAARADVTPNTIAPVSTTTYSPGAPYVQNGESAQLPQGFLVYYRCWLTNPGKVSHFDLLRRMPGARWKGCVEARPEPYDLTDAPPSAADANSLFVPYFAPDETYVETAGGNIPYNNDYLSDFHGAYAANNGVPPGWTHEWEWGRLSNILKYDGVNRPDIQEQGNRVTKGPNAACPDEVLPLTSNRAQILNRIDSLSYWPGGGTISSEGVMWGWRSLSPNAPFALGAPYGGTTKKYMVLMSDGMNSLVANRPNSSTTLLSEYTAYGYLTAGRMNGTTFPASEVFLNDRLARACANAKAQGITIFTILFRETDATARQLLRNCASRPEQALLANNGAQLATAFQTIASDLSKLRLVR